MICSFLNWSALSHTIKINYPQVTKTETSNRGKVMEGLEKAGLNLDQSQEFKITGVKFIDPSIVSLSLIHIDDYQIISKSKHGNQDDYDDQRPAVAGLLDVTFDLTDSDDKDFKPVFNAGFETAINKVTTDEFGHYNAGATGALNGKFFGDTVKIGPSVGLNADFDGNPVDGTMGLKVDLGLVSFGAKVGCRTEACVVIPASFDLERSFAA